jgi:Family of unknown function (DUF6188)
VSDIWPSGETYVILYGLKAERVQFRFAGEAHLAEGHRKCLDGGGAWESLLPLFQLRRRRVKAASVIYHGHIELLFEDSMRLLVSPDQQYESWEMSGPADLLLVCPRRRRSSDYREPPPP